MMNAKPETGKGKTENQQPSMELLTEFILTVDALNRFFASDEDMRERARVYARNREIYYLSMGKEDAKLKRAEEKERENAAQQIKDKRILYLFFHNGVKGDFGKAVLRQAYIPLKGISNLVFTKDQLKDKDNYALAAANLIRICSNRENRKIAYQILFWATLIMATEEETDKTNAEYFAGFYNAFQIPKEELNDIWSAINALYGCRGEYRTEAARSLFSGLEDLTILTVQGEKKITEVINRLQTS